MIIFLYTIRSSQSDMLQHAYSATACHPFWSSYLLLEENMDSEMFFRVLSPFFENPLFGLDSIMSLFLEMA